MVSINRQSDKQVLLDISFAFESVLIRISRSSWLIFKCVVCWGAVYGTFVIDRPIETICKKGISSLFRFHLVAISKTLLSPPSTDLYKDLPQGWHDVGGVEAAEAPDRTQRPLTDLKHLVVQGNEEGAQILRLSQVVVETIVQREKYTETDIRIWKVKVLFWLPSILLDMLDHSHYKSIALNKILKCWDDREILTDILLSPGYP